MDNTIFTEILVDSILSSFKEMNEVLRSNSSNLEKVNNFGLANGEFLKAMELLELYCADAYHVLNEKLNEHYWKLVSEYARILAELKQVLRR